jgi:pSer/pThr/pTyr-binding forkhead associated (FHA) protein
VLVVDDTRTVSKTHALLRRRADAWMIADLGSTNGVVVVDGETEIEVAPGADHEVQERFLLGDAELRLVRTDA